MGLYEEIKEIAKEIKKEGNIEDRIERHSEPYITLKGDTEGSVI